MNLNLTADQISMIFDAMDIDKSGQIDYSGKELFYILKCCYSQNLLINIYLPVYIFRVHSHIPWQYCLQEREIPQGRIPEDRFSMDNS